MERPRRMVRLTERRGLHVDVVEKPRRILVEVRPEGQESWTQFASLSAAWHMRTCGAEDAHFAVTWSLEQITQKSTKKSVTKALEEVDQMAVSRWGATVTNVR